MKAERVESGYIVGVSKIFWMKKCGEVMRFIRMATAAKILQKNTVCETRRTQMVGEENLNFDLMNLLEQMTIVIVERFSDEHSGA